MALSDLQSRIDAEELMFWGKITGIKSDYYVALAITYSNNYEFPNKKFFWALSEDFSFREMPTLTQQDADLIDRDEKFFQGTPNEKIGPNSGEDQEGEEQQEQDAEEEEGDKEDKEEDYDNSESADEEIKVPKRDLVELDRLHTVVLAIENDCQIAPVGAFKMTPEHQVRRNGAFKGLSSADCLNLENYQHFRNVQSEQKKADLDQPSIAFDSRFLEPASDDMPKGCWIAQMDSKKQSVLIRSLAWPGYTFYHKQGSNRFGAIYMGDGLKNLELHFMIQ